ncbi:thiosulfate reductase cytochrome b subunit [Rhodobacter aestuarii]|uniref:Thiosulfate reductase cytochrome b subunit n=1 Tax=Rhodobacter aestuarii TaxID=453582 RepID=A0A1N7JDS4_9RHOB|nr:cytochrome b/b6 domain-containing protein [Rhodobacter aestuarii]PTV96898.1 thiosulfate reductase cytochrome b subunit [Rhodobacter aestuarii]SIS47424.1 Thiosulfate reductase cytochrome b subunit [Rhodobacter aestuarii]
MVERCVKVYSRFNRLWHWSQAGSIMLLFFTGARIMGLHEVMPFGLAVTVHSLVAIALLVLWVFATFWLFTTHGWKQFIPRLTGFLQVARFYAYGVFKGEEHPYSKTLERRHNPLQAGAYFALKMALFPAIWVTGLAYLSYGFWDSADGQGFWLTIIANLHVLAAFAIGSFVVAHLYLLTIGHGFKRHVQPMITGYDRIDLNAEEEAYLEQKGLVRATPLYKD